ncbi:MAG: hypothetical protein WD509_00560 [Candidatus Paceibacterota bacterium]
MNIRVWIQSRTKKVKVLLTLLVLIIAVTGYYYSYLFIPISEFKDVDEWMEERPRSRGEYINYITKLEAAAKADDVGGQTPQETLALWVEAVKADDLEKASTYFLITRQKDALETMNLSKENNVLPDVIAEIEDGGYWLVNKYTGARFNTETLSEQRAGAVGFEFEFVRNDDNGVWKIEEF